MSRIFYNGIDFLAALCCLNPDQRRYGWLSAILLGLTIGFYVLSVDAFAQTPVSTDFSKFHASTLYLLDGRDPYAPVPIEFYGPLPVQSEIEQKTMHPNLNPPFFVLLTLPFGLLPFQLSFRLWTFLSVLSGAIALYLLTSSQRSVWWRIMQTVGLALLVSLHFSTWVNAVLGQVTLPLLLLTVLLWRALGKRNMAVAGLMLGLAMSIKLFMGLFLVYFFLRREWRLLIWSVAAGLFFFFLPLPIFGPDLYTSYLELLRGVDWHSASWNASLQGFLTRVITQGGAVEGPTRELWISLLSAGLSLLCLAGLGWTTLAGDEPEHGHDLGFSLTLIAMLLISPLGWNYYFPLLIVPGLILYRRTFARPDLAPLRLMMVSAWMLSAVPHMLMGKERLLNPAVWFTLAGFSTYALLFCFGAILTLSLRLRTQPMPKLLNFQPFLRRSH